METLTSRASSDLAQNAPGAYAPGGEGDASCAASASSALTTSGDGSHPGAPTPQPSPGATPGGGAR